MSEATKAAARPSRPSLLLGAAHLAALWALAFLQPMLALLGANPEFFVARGNTSTQIVIYALSLAFVPPLIGLLIEAVAQRFSDRLRWLVHLVLMGIVGSALALEFLKKVVDLPAGLMIALAIGLGAIGAIAYARYRFPRSFMDILTPAPLIILAVFIFFSPATKLVFPPGDPTVAEVAIDRPVPVVMVIFDEFPTASLLDSKGQIDRSRFPAFAELASKSTWYRNATGRGAYTPLAVPAILTGRTPTNDDLPIASDNPDSIFTLLGGRYHMNVVENATRVCPQDLCPREAIKNTDAGLGDLFSDLRVVSAHLLLPDAIRQHLPDISKSFGNFANETGNLDAGVTPVNSGDYGSGPTGASGTTGVEPPRTGQGAARALGRAFAGESADDEIDRVNSFAASLKAGGRPSLNLIHIEKPHYPWRHIPDGQRYSNVTNEWSGLLPNDGPWKADNRIVDIALQRHLLEVGFTDTLLLRIINRLKRTGLWDRALVVVTADHGAGFGEQLERRRAVPENLGQIASVPLFVKAPGQDSPEVVERHTCTTDILPQVATELGIDYPWPTEVCPPDRVSVVNSPSGEASASLENVLRQRASQVSRIDRVFGTGHGWGPVYRFGPNKQLIGRKPASFKLNRSLVGARALPDRRNKLLNYDPEAPAVPGLLQRGTVKYLNSGRVLAVALNGRIEGVGWTFDDGLGRGPGYSILLPPDAPRKGYNRVEVFLVEGGGTKLQRLYTGPPDPNPPTKHAKPAGTEGGGSGT